MYYKLKITNQTDTSWWSPDLKINESDRSSSVIRPETLPKKNET